MTITLTYDTQLSRVRIDATALDSGATAADVERSVDQITWTTVRGGLGVPVTGGVMPTVDDYEFAVDVPNWYRVRAYDSAAITFVAAGTAASSGGAASLNPALPAGLAANDLLLVLASIRNGSPAGTVNLPAGYTSLVTPTEHVRLFGKIATGGEAAPMVTFGGIVANADVIAQTCAFRHADLTLLASNNVLNASAQNIARPALAAPDLTRLMVRFAWRQDDWSTISTPAGFTGSIGATSSTAGNDAAQAWAYLITAEAEDQPSGNYTVTGGAAAISRAGIAAFGQRVTNLDTNDITPTLDTVWIKSLARPYLNRPVTVLDFSPVVWPARAGVFSVEGRSNPVVVSDLRGPANWTLDVLTGTPDEARDFALLLRSGEPVFVHVPADCDVPGGYGHIGDASAARPEGGRRSVRRMFTLPLTEIAAPGPDVIGAAGTCATVLATYATCQDVITNEPTCADLLDLIGDPSEVIVA